MFGLGVQLRRLASQMAMKIAEACGRYHVNEFAQSLGQARGSGVELEYALLLSRDLDLIQPHAYESLLHQVIELRRMLSGLLRAARAQPFDTLTVDNR